VPHRRPRRSSRTASSSRASLPPTGPQRQSRRVHQRASSRSFHHRHGNVLETQTVSRSCPLKRDLHELQSLAPAPSGTIGDFPDATPEAAANASGYVDTPAPPHHPPTAAPASYRLSANADRVRAVAGRVRSNPSEFAH